MRTETLIGVGLFTFALVLTVYSWQEYLQSDRVKEGFASPQPDIISDAMIQQISDANDPKPTQDQAEQAYQTLLRFVRDDFSQGIKYVKDFRQRFYGDDKEFRKDLDIRTLLDNYHTPLQRL
jgi:hypothetical protein